MLVSATKLHFGYAGEPLLEEITFQLNEGDRVGLIGPNGEGKTTLLKLILGELTPESGEIFRKNGMRIGYLAQNGGYSSFHTVEEEMQAIFAEDKRLLAALRETETAISQTDGASKEYAALSARYEFLNKQISARDSYNYEVRIAAVLSGMGFAERKTQLVSTMSGGEKTRLQLCKLLLESPDLLILDEPTNHLDTKTLFWLEDYLASYKGAILTVSHDRYFLDKLVKQIYELENKKLSVFKGNYSKYKVLKAEKVAHLLKEYEKQQVERAHLQEYVDKNLVRASTTKSAQSRRHKLEIMELIEKPTLPPTPPRFVFSYEQKPYENVLETQNFTLAIREKTLLEKVNFSVLRGDKVALVGDNGTGKSTLLKQIIAGKNPAIKLGRFVKPAAYFQENENLNPENTVLAELWERHVSWDQTKVRSILAQAKLHEEDMDKKVRMLSGGEKAKLALAVFECEGGNFLLLDEPTNHLDLPARESLEEALKAFDGTVLFVSHDRYFISALASKIVELENGALTQYPCPYAEYTEEKRKAKERAEESKKSVQAVPAPSKQQTGYRSKEDRAKEAQRKERIRNIEREIELLEKEEEEINNSLSDPSVTGNFTLLNERCKRLEELRERLEKLYGEYETLL